jgi:hypothetical protein
MCRGRHSKAEKEKQALIANRNGPRFAAHFVYRQQQGPQIAHSD